MFYSYEYAIFVAEMIRFKHYTQPFCALVQRELIAFFASSVGIISLALWLIALGAMLWIFPGEYNILEGGEATLRPLFTLAPMLFVLLIPALTMRTMADDTRMGMHEVLSVQPLPSLTLVLAKFTAAWSCALVALLPTLLYIYPLHHLSLSGFDVGEIIGGYCALALLAATMAAIGLFSSAITRHPLTSYLLASMLCFTSYFGFSLIASLTNQGALHNTWAGFGLQEHFEPMTHGVLYSVDIAFFIGQLFLFLVLTLQITQHPLRTKALRYKRLIRQTGIALFVLILLYIAPIIRLDLTAEGRYTLSSQSIQLLKEVDQKQLLHSPNEGGKVAPLEVQLYLNGPLNPAFDRLRTAFIDLLYELANHLSTPLSLTFVDPASAPTLKAQQIAYESLNKRGIRGLSVAQHEAGGRITQQLVYPWATLIQNGDTIPIPLLQQSIDKTPQEALQSSIESLEYQFMDALRVLTLNHPKRIAFIEGHGETEDVYLQETLNTLSRYYTIDRGPLLGGPLAPYSALLITDPQTPFTESEKFALDQYLMQGGSVLLLTGGTTYRKEVFTTTGESPTLKKELNLDDLLFTYGVRINPITLQDLQCRSIKLTSTRPGASETNILPWFFAPLLLPTANSSESSFQFKGISPLKAEYVSPISLINPHEGVRQVPLLSTSNATHSLPVPEAISLRYVEMPANDRYFNEPAQLVGALVEGTLPSVYAHRQIPEGIKALPQRVLNQANSRSRLIVVGCGNLLSNEYQNTGRSTEMVPLGYDEIAHTQLGNRGFLIQTITYLTHDEVWLKLLQKGVHPHPLATFSTNQERFTWQSIAVGAPLILLLFLPLYQLRRNYRHKAH